MLLGSPFIPAFKLELKVDERGRKKLKDSGIFCIIHSYSLTTPLSSLGLIHVGDELREVNGIPVDDKKPEEIIHILVNTKHYKINLGSQEKVIRLMISGVFLRKKYVLQ